MNKWGTLCTWNHSITLVAWPWWGKFIHAARTFHLGISRRIQTMDNTSSINREGTLTYEKRYKSKVDQDKWVSVVNMRQLFVYQTWNVRDSCFFCLCKDPCSSVLNEMSLFRETWEKAVELTGNKKKTFPWVRPGYKFSDSHYVLKMNNSPVARTKCWQVVFLQTTEFFQHSRETQGQSPALFVPRCAFEAKTCVPNPNLVFLCV